MSEPNIKVDADPTGLFVIGLVLWAFMFWGDPDVHDHFMRWLDCLNDCDSIDPWLMDQPDD